MNPEKNVTTDFKFSFDTNLSPEDLDKQLTDHLNAIAIDAVKKMWFATPQRVEELFKSVDIAKAQLKQRLLAEKGVL